ncbi:MAG: hypothetical protein PHT83_05505 [Bacilli bacterium]|nr:hypothetical protein [Bacilli bacterium]
MRRHLTKNEWKKVNKEVDFYNLKDGMEVTVDDTVDAGWYVVVGNTFNDYVTLEKMELDDEEGDE